MRRALSVLLAAATLVGLTGCRTVVESPGDDVDRRATYQAIADALPEASFGWGDPPGIVGIAASVKQLKVELQNVHQKRFRHSLE